MERPTDNLHHIHKTLESLVEKKVTPREAAELFLGETGAGLAIEKVLKERRSYLHTIRHLRETGKNPDRSIAVKRSRDTQALAWDIIRSFLTAFLIFGNYPTSHRFQNEVLQQLANICRHRVSGLTSADVELKL